MLVNNIIKEAMRDVKEYRKRHEDLNKENRIFNEAFDKDFNKKLREIKSKRKERTKQFDSIRKK